MPAFDFTGTGIRPLSTMDLAGVTLVPARRTGLAEQPFLLSGYTDQGVAHPAFRLRRHYGASGDLPFAPAEAELTGEWFYGGLFIPHWGHFLLESLARVWALRGRAANIVWHTLNPTAAPLKWQAELLALLGLGTARHHFVVRPTAIERLTVPEPGFILGTSLHVAQALALGVHRFGPPEPGRRLWLSRSGLSLGAIEGEDVLEDSLARQGWTIFHPEGHGVTDQLNALAEAELVSGFEGSAFHTLILGADIRARVRIFARSRSVAPNYAVIAATKHLDQQVLAVATEQYGTRQQKPLYRIVDVAGIARAAAAL